MKELQTTISSRKVAEMMDVRHGDLLEKIDKINKDFDDGKIRYQKYWIEDTFENRGKQYREYQVTKLGCEFLAHKTTGRKGNLFTARYMDKFEEMEKSLKELNRPSYMIDDPIARAERWIIEQKEKQLLLEENKQLQPKADKFDNFMNSNGLYTSTQVAKLFDISSARALNKILHDNKLIYKQSGVWLPYSTTDKSWFKSIVGEYEGRTYNSLKITPKGVMGLSELLHIDINKEELNKINEGEC